MKKHLFSLAVLPFALLLAGCGSSAVPEEAKDKPLASRLGDSIDLSLAELLTKPRAELAAMADEFAAKIQIQEKGRREGQLPFTLIPTLRLPLAVPVLRQAHYSATAGFSLPPYLAEGSKDSALALHLARYGDREAANHLVEQGDADTSRQINEALFERDYPLEWTRLVDLLLHAAQVRLATGDVEGGTELVMLHRQLLGVLEPKAKKGMLGAVLLSRGRETLARAAAAWRTDKREELAVQADAILAEWGDVPSLPIALQLGTPRAQVTRLLRSAGDGRALPALCPTRAFDLWALPFPDEGAEAVIAGFDEAGQLAEVLITYRAGFGEYFPEPDQLAFLLEERPLRGEDGPKATGLRNRTYHLGELNCAVSVVVHGAGVGAFVQLGRSKESGSAGSLARDFGGVHLDRTFEQDRVRLAPEQPGETGLTITGKALAKVRNPLPALKLTQAELRRETGHNLVASLVLRYADSGGGPPPLHQVALPLWMAFGLGQMQGVSDQNGGHLALAWQDARTHYTLRLPYDTIQPVELEIRDQQGSGHLAERETAAAAVDRRERQERLEARKPLVRLARYLEQIELGMTRNQVRQTLPPGQAVLKRDVPGGLVVTFRGEPAKTDAAVLRQLFIRFDQTERVVEVRARYVDGPGAGQGTSWMSDLLRSIKKRAGAPSQAPSPWSTIWTDLPPQKPAPLRYHWQDDITFVAYQRDAGSVEIVVRDCSLDPEPGQPLPPSEHLPRGPVNCQLGFKREQLLQQWAVVKPDLTGDGALVLRPPQGSPFDAILVWFDNDQAVRIVARHVPTGTQLTNPTQWAQALTDAWGRELAMLGWPRRQDVVANEVVQSLGWHDDRTRIRMFWQETDTGPPRVFTEWKDLTR
jgi:hypothetical protein